jgi:hypothetical protein
MTPFSAPTAPLPPLTRRENLALGAFSVALGFLVCLQRWPGIGPDALWLDDLWVAVLARSANLRELLSLPYPAPPGFVLLLKAVAPWAGTQAWAYQLPAFVFSLALIYLTGWAAGRWTGSLWMALAAAFLAAFNPTLSVYSLRVKSFSLEAAATVMILALAWRNMQRPGRASAAVLACGAALAVPFAFNAVFLGALLSVGLPMWRYWTMPEARREAVRETCTAFAIYAPLVLLSYLLILKPRSTPALVDYWKDGYLPVHGLREIASFLSVQGVALVRDAFPFGLGWMGLLVPVGMAALLAYPRRRALGVAAIIFCLELIAASALHLYPLGRGRTDIFTYPITQLLAAASLLWVPARGRRFLPAVPLLLALWMLTPGARVHYKYPESGARAIVERAQKLLAPEDGLVVYPFSNYAAAFYGPWPFHLAPTQQISHGFYARPDRPLPLALEDAPAGVNFNGDPDVLRLQLVRFLSHGPPRIAVIAGRTNPIPMQGIAHALEETGYRLVRREDYPEQSCVLLCRRER